jgi:hyperosmotically inducible periplasmic protein
MSNKTTPLFAMGAIAFAALMSFGAGCGTAQPPNTQINDSKITAKVKSKLASDVRPSSITNIVVNTTNGVVTLAGQVENDEIRRRAEDIARGVAGVTKVNNNLQVEANGVAQQQPPGSSSP